MKFTDLFSHPNEPEVTPKTDRDSEPVRFPIFSDNDSVSQSPSVVSPS